MPLTKRKVDCPDCGEKDVEIFSGVDGAGVCKCGTDVEAVYRHAHYNNLSKKVDDAKPEHKLEPKPEPEPKPELKGKDKKEKKNPFSFF